MATNEILPFCPTDTGSNLLSQSAYNSTANRTSGSPAGFPERLLINKAMRQSGAISAGVGQFLADHQGANITDALTAANLSAYIEAAIIAVGNADSTAHTTLTGDNGSVKFGSGLILKWGFINQTIAAGDYYSITYTTAFPNVAAVSLCANNSSVGSGGSAIPASYSAVRVSLSALQIWNTTTISKADFVSWMALGY
jgi:hypothetical protein